MIQRPLILLKSNTFSPIGFLFHSRGLRRSNLFISPWESRRRSAFEQNFKAQESVFHKGQIHSPTICSNPNKYQNLHFLLSLRQIKCKLLIIILLLSQNSLEKNKFKANLRQIKMFLWTVCIFNWMLNNIWVFYEFTSAAFTFRAQHHLILFHHNFLQLTQP